MVDVLGLSHYAPMPLQMTFASFEVSSIVGCVLVGGGNSRSELTHAFRWC